jgi:hypothetical protein
MSGAFLMKGNRMDDKQFNKAIGYAIMAILAYYALQFVIQYLIYGVVGLVILRIILEIQRNKR